MPARPRQHDDDRDSMTTLSPARTCTRELFTSSPKVTPSSSSDAAVNTKTVRRTATYQQLDSRCEPSRCVAPDLRPGGCGVRVQPRTEPSRWRTVKVPLA